MKTIYTDAKVVLVGSDVIVAQAPTCCELSIDESNEELYNQYRMMEITQAHFDSMEQTAKQQMIDRLWRTCNEYQERRIATLGAVNLGQKTTPNTKAQAILAWIENLWALYYTKRDLITSTRIGNSLDVINGENLITIFDFSEAGELPYSYKEAMEEV